MFRRRFLAIVGFGVAAACGLVLALAGCFRLGFPGLVVMALASVVVAAGVLAVSGDDDSSAGVRRAETAAAGTAAGVLLVSGVDAVAGGVVAALTAGFAGAVLATWWLLRRWRRRGSEHPGTSGLRGPGAESPADPTALARLQDMTAPVRLVATAQLGREWLAGSGLLGCPLLPAIRESLIARRAEILDEFERRDPAGFARWMADVHPDSDPADFVGAPSSPEG